MSALVSMIYNVIQISPKMVLSTLLNSDVLCSDDLRVAVNGSFKNEVYVKAP